MLKSELVELIAKEIRPKVFEPESTKSQKREITLRVNQFLTAAIKVGMEFPGGIEDDVTPKKERLVDREERIEVESNRIRPDFIARRKALKLSLTQLAARLDINLRTLESFERRNAAPDEAAFKKISEWVENRT